MEIIIDLPFGFPINNIISLPHVSDILPGVSLQARREAKYGFTKKQKNKKTSRTQN